jgi:UDP-glucuronate decarboxylase
MTTRLLMTGATGFFGRAVLRVLRQEIEDGGGRDVSVETLSRRPDVFFHSYPEFAELPWLRVHAGDILDSQSLSQLAAPDWVLHAAADSVNVAEPKCRYRQIVDGTRNVLDFALVSETQRFLYVSSGAVYGKNAAVSGGCRENDLGGLDPLLLGSTYGIAKLSAEHLCALFAQDTGMSASIARCFAFLGQDLPLNAHFAIGNFIRDALWGDEVVVRGDGFSIRSYMDQRDLAVWLLEILRRGESARAYNVGSESEISILALAELVVSVVSPGKRIHVVGGKVSSGAGDRYVPCVNRAQRELGLEVTIPLKESIRHTASILRGRALQWG